MNDQIDIIPSAKINIQKWNDCIDASANAMIYARAFYLDCMSDNWCGVVVNDYETVMPVCFRKKMGIKYCYDIPYTQQLGWFSKIDFNNEKILLEKLFSFCKYGDYNFNFSNNVSCRKKSCTNFIIDLSQNVENIRNKYENVQQKNLKMALKKNFLYSDEKTEDAIECSKTLYRKRFRHVGGNDFRRLETLTEVLSKEKRAFAKKIVDEKNELLASVLLLKDDRRIYNIINNVTPKGRKLNANHFLYDHVLKEFAETNLLFDFEGSDLPGVKKFYKSFGAIDQPYFQIHFNKLPFPLNQLKS